MYLFKEFRSGKKRGTTEVFSKQLNQWTGLESRLLKPVVRSGSIGRYRATAAALVLFPYDVKDCEARLFPPEEMRRQYPLAWNYLERNKKLLENREKGAFRDSQWYRFGRSQNLGLWEQSKLMVPYMITELAAYWDREEGYYFINVTTGGYGITSDESLGSLAYLCGLLNSRLLDFYLKHVSTNFHGGYFAANKQYIELLPIHPVDASVPSEKAKHDKIVVLVERMLDLHKRLGTVKAPHDVGLLKRQIEETNREIDELVYGLYGLTEEEIATVEGRSENPSYGELECSIVGPGEDRGQA